MSSLANHPPANHATTSAAMDFDDGFPEIELCRDEDAEPTAPLPTLPRRGMIVARRIAYAAVLAGVVLLVRQLRRARR